MNKPFFQHIEELSKKKNSLLCVGLDPRVDIKENESCVEKIVAANKYIIEETSEYAVCYKPNIAFYEAFGPDGLIALQQTLKLIPEDTAILLDTKRSDIGATAEAYAQAIFGHLDAQATTLSPYMGRDAVDPFLKWDGRGIFMLCRTSNPGASPIQTLTVQNTNEPFYIAVGRECLSWSENIGLVVGGNDSEALVTVRSEFPNAWILAPGIGAQGGSMEEAMSAGMREDGLGILPVVARGISQAENPGAAAKEYRDKINQAREAVFASGKITAKNVKDNQLLKGLIETSCFKVGEFTLKSGKKSPFYIDLRRVMSSPKLLRIVAKAYAALLKGLEFDRIAGIPVAALPLATAVSLETGIPMIFPRMTAKSHGSGNKVEGEYKKGEKIALLDDLITTGKSKVEAIEILQEAGLVVEDLVVLLERGVQGRKDMEAAGINLHSYIQVEQLLEMCAEMGIINGEQEKEMKKFVVEG